MVRHTARVVDQNLPAEVTAVFAAFRCCEFATVAADGTPVTWPVATLHLPDRGVFVVCTSIGFPAKAANIARDARVSMLFSDATGSGLARPPTVLVQGHAEVADGVRTWGDDLGALLGRVARMQPISRWFSRTAPVRWFMDWYYMRLVIYVTPARVTWWPAGDTSAGPQAVALDVG